MPGGFVPRSVAVAVWIPAVWTFMRFFSASFRRISEDDGSCRKDGTRYTRTVSAGWPVLCRHPVVFMQSACLQPVHVRFRIEQDGFGWRSGRGLGRFPAPEGRFYLCLRAYLPRTDMLNGRYALPPLQRLNDEQET